MKLLSLLFIVASAASAQQYPQWFLSQGKVRCASKVVMITRAPSLYNDTAIALAFRAGCNLLAKYTNIRVSGGQAFWTTEAGVHSMGSRYTEAYDTSLSALYQSTLKVIASFIDKNKAIVLTGDSSSCTLSDDLKKNIPIEKIPQPKWVEEIPSNTMYYYGVGTSESYYYESSSWERAEHNAFMALARTLHSSVISLQKNTSIESQEVFNEDIDVELQNIEIVARWRDLKKKVFYVLAKIKR